ncbi:MAG: hypothetical protein HKN91_09805, partial [Acidimicrobiia bacterium]|nr:hypothetical protein [Acidimicrobiia bacterium]
MPAETDQTSLEAQPIDIDTSSVEWREQRWYRVLGYYFSLTTSNSGFDDYVHTVIGAFQVANDPA